MILSIFNLFNKY